MDGSMIITVLGSSGQIGAYLSEYLSKKGHIVREFDIVNGIHQDMTHIPNTYLRNAIMESDFVFFLAFDAISTSPLIDTISSEPIFTGPVKSD